MELIAQANNKEIYDIKGLLYTRVTIEPPHPKREIPQCTNCQRFGHTKGYCFRDPKCVKCDGAHATKDCSRKARDNKVKCTNCGGNHPANFRGCLYHKNIQKRLHPQVRNTHPPGYKSVQTRNPGTTYAQVTSGNSQQSQQITEERNIPAAQLQQQPNKYLEDKIDKMLDKMDKMLEIILTMLSKQNDRQN